MPDTIKNQIIFKNGHAYDLLAITDDSITRRIQGQDRKCIDAQFALDQFDVVKAEAYLAGNLDTLTISRDVTHDDGTITHTEWVHTNFNIVQHIGIDSVPLFGGDDTTPPTAENRVSLLLAQLTYLEVQTAQQAAALDALGQQVVALSLGGAS